MRKTKSEGKTVGIFAISSQTVRNVLRISQCEKPQQISQCEISQCENHIANFAMRKTTANFAMRNFAMRKPHCKFRNAKRKFRNAKRKFRNAKWLPTDCQLFAKIHVLLFFFFSLLIFNICSKICTKLLKLKQ